MLKSRHLWLALTFLAGPAMAQDVTPQQRAEKRFPQPVRVGDLRDRLVIEPSNHQRVLGRVDGVVRGSDGALRLVVREGGLLGIGARPVAVPVDAVALLGRLVEIVDVDPADVGRLQTFDPASATPVPPDETIRIGVTRN